MARLVTVLAFVPVATMRALACGGGDDSAKPAPTPAPAASPEPEPAKPARHNDGNFMNALDDAYLAQVIRDGGASVGKSTWMAARGGTLSDADIADVIAFIRSLADPPYPRAAGTAKE